MKSVIGKFIFITAGYSRPIRADDGSVGRGSNGSTNVDGSRSGGQYSR